VVTVYSDEAFRDLEEGIKISVAALIGNYFSYASLSFGEAFSPQHLNRLIYDIDEVRYSTVDNIKETIIPQFNEVIQLNNLTTNIEFV